MARKQTRASKRTRRARARQSAPGVEAVIGEIERVLATPLPELMDGPEDRVHAQELARQADAAAAIGRFRVLLGFVGGGRRATQSGKLTPFDALELAALLGVSGAEEGEVRSMEDLPDVAELFDWAVASELLVTRGTRVLPGLRAEDLSRDPLAVWFKAAMTLLERGLLGGFRRGWRKHYVEFLDAGVPYLLGAVLNAGGDVPLAAIKDLVWEQVARAYDYELGDTAERRRVDRLVDAIVFELVGLGAAERSDQDLRLTGLGEALATAAAVLTSDDEPA
jgi:hypothetical protein